MYKALLVALIGLFLSTDSLANSCSALTGQIETFTLPPGSSCGTTNQYQNGPDQCCNMNIDISAEDEDGVICVYKYTGSSCSPPPELELTNPPQWSEDELTGVSGTWANQTSNMLNNIATRLNTISNKNTQDTYAIRSYVLDSATSVRQSMDYSEGRIKDSVNDGLFSISQQIDDVLFTQSVAASTNRDILAAKIDAIPNNEKFNELLEAINAIQDETILSNQLHQNQLVTESINKTDAMSLQLTSLNSSVNQDFAALDDSMAQLSQQIANLDTGSGGGGTGGDPQWQTDVLDTISSIDEAIWSNVDTLNSLLSSASSTEQSSFTISEYIQLLSSDFNDFWIEQNDNSTAVQSSIENSSSGLGQQLNDIKTAILESSGSGGGGLPVGALDATNLELQQLRQLVADNHAQSQAELQNLNATASGQSLSLASMSSKLTGIGQSLDDLKSGLSGDAYQLPGTTDADIKQSLGVDDSLNRDSLFSDDVVLDDVTGTYDGWLSDVQTCPSLPTVQLPFVGEFTWDFTLFCDILQIFGVLVMAAAYFSVPFIIFGGKK